MIENMSYIGYAECDNCKKFVHYSDPGEIHIWYHPDDPNPLVEVDCKNCGAKVSSRITLDHMINFRKRGCVIHDWNLKFSDLKEQDIDEWDIESDRASFF